MHSCNQLNDHKHDDGHHDHVDGDDDDGHRLQLHQTSSGYSLRRALPRLVLQFLAMRTQI